MEKNLIISPGFKKAVSHYLYMLERDYPKRPLLKLIADKFQLNKIQRNLLLRGIAPKATSTFRAKKKTDNISGQSLFIDFYNIYLTICNYNYGATLFICTDTYLRDCGEIYGKIKDDSLVLKIISLILSHIRDSKPQQAVFILDSPVSGSGDTAGYLNRELKKNDISGTAYTRRSPDYELKKLKNGIIATSDSIIIEKTAAKVYDLAYYILKKNYQPDFLNLNQLVEAEIS